MLEVKRSVSSALLRAAAAVVGISLLAVAAVRGARHALVTEQQPIKVWYWPYVGRAGCIFHMLDEAQYPYEHVSRVFPIAGRASALGSGYYDTFAPPIIQDGDLVLSQSTAICMYLGEKVGFADGVPNRYKAIQHMNDLLDFFEGVVQSGGDAATLHRFIDGGRFGSLLANIERQVVGPHYYGEKLTYLDFYLVTVFDFIVSGVFDRLGKVDFAELTAPYPKVMAALEAVHALPSYKANTLVESIDHGILSPRTVPDDVIADY